MYVCSYANKSFNMYVLCIYVCMYVCMYVYISYANKSLNMYVVCKCMYGCVCVFARKLFMFLNTLTIGLGLNRRQIMTAYAEYAARQEALHGKKVRRALVKPVFNLFHGESKNFADVYVNMYVCMQGALI